MPNYSNVQFIAWEIYTGPVYSSGAANHYQGIARAEGDRRWDVLSQCLDISARVEFTRLAMEAAYQAADPDTNTLKIFMAPEFLYRGAAGAYLSDLLNGWVEDAPKDFSDGRNPLPPPYNRAWGGLFGELRALAADPRFQDWVFIFGTAVGAAFSCAKGRVITDDTGSQQSTAMGWNLALVQCGGTNRMGDGCYFVEKHLKSAIDFVHFNQAHAKARFFTQEEMKHGSEPTWRVLDRLIQHIPGEQGGSAFRFPDVCKSGGSPLQFGLEICLDHAQAYEGMESQEQVTGRLARSKMLVDIQLVPSCGLWLIPSSLALAPKDGPKDCSYAFNCDGLITNDSNDPWLDGTLSGHVHLWSGSALPGEGNPPQVLENVIDSVFTPGHIPVSGTVDLSRIQVPAESLQALQVDLSQIEAGQLWRSHKSFPLGGNSGQYLWPGGAGFVRALPPRPLAAPPQSPQPPRLPARTDGPDGAV